MDTAQRQSVPLEQLLLSVERAAQMLDISRAKFYEHLAAGDIKAVKIGRRTAIRHDEIEAFVKRLPTAVFRKPSARCG